ncbi:MAG TPA: hypothetical protein VNJ03_14055 [Vicinamibacterales bacterium]|nr:hypothetical protein [Vicinamibacterales bacterium]
MIEIHDTAPGVDVHPAEYARLLGYPPGWVLSERAMELADGARGWYAQHGRPWVYARQASELRTGEDTTIIEGVTFSGTRLRNTLHAAGAHSAILVAASAGPELEREAQVRWRDEKPDEYFFLEMYGSAVVEHLVMMTGATLCAWAERDGCAVLPHYSPGYPEWSIEEQPALLGLMGRTRADAIPLELLDSGMLRPKKSLLAVFGVTRHTDRVRRLTGLIPCENCSLAACQYRRAPYRRARTPAAFETSAIDRDTADEAAPLDRNASYSVSVKALQRWSEDRLSIASRPDGGVDAIFRYEGTTCTNTGRPLEFHYHVGLGPREEGYPIREQRCGPAAGDEGYTSMCRYISHGEQLMTSIELERPLNGQALDDVVRWTRPANSAGCYCDPESRQHKWGLVLETIHYTLARQPDHPGPLAGEKAKRS